jgi:hypothetical protein
MKIGRRRKVDRASTQGASIPADVPTDPELSRKDIVAVIIAMIQLFLPLIVGLVLVGAVVALILR